MLNDEYFLLNAGDEAPEFSLRDQLGRNISLRDFYGKRVILYFYPRDMTPGCAMEACEFRDKINEFKKKKTVVLGISKDSEALHQRFMKKYGLNFSLLVDHEGEVCENYGVRQKIKVFGNVIFNPIRRTTFIITSDGFILKIYRKVKVKGHVNQILQDLI